MEKTKLTHGEVGGLVGDLLQKFGALNLRGPGVSVYAVPRGGVPVAYLLAGRAPGLRVVDDPMIAHVFVDDIIDSGRTRDRYQTTYQKPFLALVDKLGDPAHAQMGWVVFPWELCEDGADENIEENIVRILEFIGEDPSREGLHDTPKRVAAAWLEWTSGYRVDPQELIRCFSDGGEGYDEMVLVRQIPFYSHCEHHMAPFFGTVDVAYIPNGRIIGLSKIPRIVEVFARRLQVQERLTAQIAMALMKGLEPKGVAVSIRARHLCMESRGVHKQGSDTVTNVLLGVFRVSPPARAEFMSAIG
jgi:GTP cyclohydrolase I